LGAINSYAYEYRIKRNDGSKEGLEGLEMSLRSIGFGQADFVELTLP